MIVLLVNLSPSPTSQLADFIARYRAVTREQSIEAGYLSPTASAKGSPQVLPPGCHSEAGQLLLRDAKDILFALLFEEKMFDRVERELLALTVPQAKMHALAVNEQILYGRMTNIEQSTLAE